jgi:hypothetical protein
MLERFYANYDPHSKLLLWFLGNEFLSSLSISDVCINPIVSLSKIINAPNCLTSLTRPSITWPFLIVSQRVSLKGKYNLVFNSL